MSLPWGRRVRSGDGRWLPRSQKLLVSSVQQAAWVCASEDSRLLDCKSLQQAVLGAVEWQAPLGSSMELATGHCDGTCHVADAVSTLLCSQLFQQVHPSSDPFWVLMPFLAP